VLHIGAVSILPNPCTGFKACRRETWADFSAGKIQVCLQSLWLTLCSHLQLSSPSWVEVWLGKVCCFSLLHLFLHGFLLSCYLFHDSWSSSLLSSLQKIVSPNSSEFFLHRVKTVDSSSLAYCSRQSNFLWIDEEYSIVEYPFQWLLLHNDAITSDLWGVCCCFDLSLRYSFNSTVTAVPLYQLI
jgi:hypothetical protein